MSILDIFAYVIVSAYLIMIVARFIFRGDYLDYWFFIRNNEFCVVTAKYREWCDNANKEFYDISTFLPEYRSQLSEEKEITFLAENLKTDMDDRIFVRAVHDNGLQNREFFYPESKIFPTVHIPLDKVIDIKPIKVTFWSYIFHGKIVNH